MKGFFSALMFMGASAIAATPAHADLSAPTLPHVLVQKPITPIVPPEDSAGEEMLSEVDEEAGDDAAAADEPDEGLSKKSQFLAEKSTRKKNRATAPLVNLASGKSLTLRNAKTQESITVPLDPRGFAETQSQFERFLRCRFTNTAAEMDKRLLSTLVQVAHRFKAGVIEIVSGYRSPKYQLMLRKKGHEVARDSEHTRGNAVDFRLPAVKTRKLLAYVKSLHLGGVGYYPQSGFVHADVGRVRYWRGH